MTEACQDERHKHRHRFTIKQFWILLISFASVALIISAIVYLCIQRKNGQILKFSKKERFILRQGWSDYPNPTHVLVKIYKDAPTFHTQIESLCRTIFKNPNLYLVLLEQSTIALTNSVYFLSLSEKADETRKASSNIAFKVVLRIVEGKTTDLGMLMSLKRQGLAIPGVLGTFTNGSLEQFIPGRCLKGVKEMCSFKKDIAMAMKSLHELPIKGAAHHELDNYQLWNKIEELKGHVEAEGEFGWVKEFAIDKAQFEHLPLVFCHHDIHPGNVMLIDHEAWIANEALAKASISSYPTNQNDPLFKSKLILIDFEFAAMSYAIIDIANYWCEWIFEPSELSRKEQKNVLSKGVYQERFPTKTEQIEFFNAYGISFSDKDLDSGIKTSHLLWGLWAVIQAQRRRQEHQNGNSFDYEAYARARFKLMLRN